MVCGAGSPKETLALSVLLLTIYYSECIRAFKLTTVKTVHFDFSAGALKTVKKLSEERWILLTLSGCHVVLVEEGVEMNKMMVGGCNR